MRCRLPVLVLTGALAAALLGALTGCGKQASSQQTVPAIPKAPGVILGRHGSTPERTLAIQFRPYLYFDSAERWRPLEVGHFLAERFADGRGHGACPPASEPPCEDVAGVGGLVSGQVSYLDIHGQIDDGADFYTPPPALCLAPRAPMDCNGGPRSAIYYRRTTHDDRWYWDYWAFYRYNDYNGRRNRCLFYCDDHEGDWEGVTVVTTASKRPRIVGALYAAHADRVEVEPQALLRARPRSHVRVFVANGTHASYRFPCESACFQYATLAGKPLPEEDHDGAVSWGDNLDAACLRNHCVQPLPEERTDTDVSFPRPVSWNGWPGLWGQTCHRGCGKLDGSSPRAPGRQTRYLCPWVPTRKDTGGAPQSAPLSGRPRSEKVADSDRQLQDCKRQSAIAPTARRD